MEGKRKAAKASKESKEDSSDSDQLLFSPTLRYVGSNGALCPRAVYRDAKEKKKYWAKVCFEVDIHPGSYKASHFSILVAP